MKKILLAILTVLTMVCVFAISASAYQNKYYSIDIPSDFVIEEESYDKVGFTKGEDIIISVTLKENTDVDFYDMSESDRDYWEGSIKDTYGSLGTLENFECGFDGDGVSKSAMYYSFGCANPDDLTEYIYLEGVMYSEGGVLYHIFVVYDEDADYDLIYDTMNSIVFTPDGSSASGATGQKTYYKSQNGILSLTLPEGFVEEDGTGSLDKMWMSKDNTFGVSTLITDNY